MSKALLLHKVVFLADLNMVTVHVVALTEKYNFNYTADLSAHSGRVNDVDGRWVLCCGKEEKNIFV